MAEKVTDEDINEDGSGLIYLHPCILLTLEACAFLSILGVEGFGFCTWK